METDHIDPTSPIPRYVQLSDILTSQIRDKSLLPGDKLPAERELVQQYGIARMTVRQAIDLLIADGVVHRERGRGAFVALGALLPNSPLNRLPPTSAAQSNLPLQTTPFIGRDEELELIANHIDDPYCRLLTLAGPGGVGKTRLALAAAADRVGRYEHGVFFAPLSSVATVDQLVPAIASSLRFTFHGRGELREQLIDFLRAKKLLLLLDTFEHLLDGVDLLADILGHAPDVRILVTSRESLQLQEEWVIPVEGLPVPERPEADAFDEHSSIALFLERARRRSPTFTVDVSQREHLLRICRAVDGMPLGIELAAAWTHELSCEDIAGKIEGTLDFLHTSFKNVPDRHRTLRASFEHSWQLLSDNEREAFKRLTVFRGGFTRESAEEAMDCGPDLLSALLEKCLLRRSPDGRYDIHDLLKQFTREKLAEDAEQEEHCVNLHGTYYIRYLSERQARLESKQEHEALEEIAQELENVRTAWQWAIRSGRVEDIGKGIVTLFSFYQSRVLHDEAADVIGQAVKMLEERSDGKANAILGLAMSRYGIALLDSRQLDLAMEIIHKSLAIARELTDEGLEAYALRQVGTLHYQCHEYAKAKQYLEKSITLYSQLGSISGIAGCLLGLGCIAEKQGDLIGAKRMWEEALSHLRTTGSEAAIAGCLTNLGFLEKCLGDFARAKELLYQSIRIARRTGSQWGIAHSSHCLSILAFKLGHYREAKQIEIETLAVYRNIGSRWGIAWSLDHLGDICRALGQLAEAEELLQESLGLFKQLSEMDGIGWCVQHLGQVSEAAGQIDRARTYYEESLAIRRNVADRETIPYALTAMGHLSVSQEDYATADRYFTEALEIGMHNQAIPLVMDALAGIAALLAHEGQDARATQLVIMALNHPATERKTMVRAVDLLQRLQTRMSEDLFEEIKDEAETADVHEVANALLLNMRAD